MYINSVTNNGGNNNSPSSSKKEVKYHYPDEITVIPIYAPHPVAILISYLLSCSPLFVAPTWPSCRPYILRMHLRQSHFPPYVALLVYLETDHLSFVRVSC